MSTEHLAKSAGVISSIGREKNDCLISELFRGHFVSFWVINPILNNDCI